MFVFGEEICVFWRALSYHQCLYLFCICMYLFFGCILFLTSQLLLIWCFGIWKLLTLWHQIPVLPPLCFHYLSLYHDLLCVFFFLSSFGTCLIWSLHTGLRWFSFSHLEQLLPYAGHLHSSCVPPQCLQLIWVSHPSALVLSNALLFCPCFLMAQILYFLSLPPVVISGLFVPKLSYPMPLPTHWWLHLSFWLLSILE